MTEQHELRLQVNGPRPPVLELVEHLWGTGIDFNSDGDSAFPDDRQWRELTLEQRTHPWERIDIDPMSEEPLVLKVVSSSHALAHRVAEFLAERTNGRLLK